MERTIKNKAIYLLSLFLCLAISSICQSSFNFQPIVKDGARWLERSQYSVGRNVYVKYDNEYILTDKDTLIEGLTYRVIDYLFRETFTGRNNDPPSLENLKSDTTAQFWAAIREDSNKVFIHKYGSELIAYDYNLEVGDTLQTNFFISGGIIIDIDTVLFENVPRRIFHINNYYSDGVFNYIIIEGIGSSLGLFPSAPTASGVELICHSNYKNDKLYYLSSDYERCFVMNEVTTDISKISNSKIKLYPNPTSGIIQITGYEENTSGFIRIYDSVGRIMRKIIISSNSTEIDLGTAKNGIYLVRVDTDYGIWTNKFVLQK